MASTHSVITLAIVAMAAAATTEPARAQAPAGEYQILDTARSETMQRELQQAADQGYRLVPRQGGWLLSAIMRKASEPAEPVEYLLIAAARTKTMQKEMSDAAAKGFRFASIVGVGREVAIVMQRPSGHAAPTHEQMLLATSSARTMEREFQAEAAKGFEIVGQVTFIKPPIMGGNELVLLLERAVP